MKVLVTGGAGYIGSHTLVELIQQQYEPVVVDNFCNSSVDILAQVKKITDHEIPCYSIDIRNEKALAQVFLDHPDIQAVIHFAGLKAVAESVSQPVSYYDNNVNGTLSLLKISLEKVLPFTIPFLKVGAQIILLVKPQFELGPGALNKAGVVKDSSQYSALLENIKQMAQRNQLQWKGYIDSPILGGDGNAEFLGYFEKI